MEQTIDLERIVMELVVNSGNARSLAMEALRTAKDGDCGAAEETLKEADRVLLGAHEIQTELIQKELNGEKMEMSLLMVHAQDHLMNAMTVIDLVKEMVAIMKKGERQ